MLDDDRGFTDDLWRRFAELGWTACSSPRRTAAPGSGCSRSSCSPRRWAGCRCPGRGCRRRWRRRSWRRGSATRDVLAAAGRRSRAAPPWPSRRAGTAIRSTGSRRPPAGAATTWDLDGHQAGGARRPHRRPRLRGGPRCRRPGHLRARRARAASSCPTHGRHPQGRPASSSTGGPRAASGPPGDQRALLQRVVDDIGIALCAESVGACDRALADGHRLRQGPGAVRPAHRHVPGDPPQARRHAPPARAGSGGHPLRGVGVAPSTTRSGRRPPPSPRASSARRPP